MHITTHSFKSLVITVLSKLLTICAIISDNHTIILLNASSAWSGFVQLRAQRGRAFIQGISLIYGL